MWGDEAAERHEMDEPSEPLAVDGSPRLLAQLTSQYAALWARQRETEKAATEAANELWKFMDDRAERGIPKPYEICGADDGDPEHLQCQLPRGHKGFGYRNHLECRNGEIWGAWS